MSATEFIKLQFFYYIYTDSTVVSNSKQAGRSQEIRPLKDTKYTEALSCLQ